MAPRWLQWFSLERFSFSISSSHRQPREILLILSEEDGNQLCLGVTLICISDPIRPSTRACHGREVVSRPALISQSQAASSLADWSGPTSHWLPDWDSNCEPWRIYQSAMKRLHNLSPALTDTWVKLGYPVGLANLRPLLQPRPQLRPEAGGDLERSWPPLPTLGLTICT